DRKSTRLNSSHGSISYAVFCLKKKKQSRPEVLAHLILRTEVWAVLRGQKFHTPFFFFNDTATTEIYTLSLHDALPISRSARPETRSVRSAFMRLRTNT